MSRRLSLISSILLALSGAETARAQFIFREAQLVPNVNTSSRDVAPAVSNDGLTLFFASDRPGAVFGNRDLWMTTRSSDAEMWQLPVNFGETVNTRAFEDGPEVSADGNMLLFADSIWFDPNVPHRTGTGGTGDIWMTTRGAQEAEWMEPTNEGILTNVNSRWQEGEPSISPDGLSLFFESNRSGSFDLFMAIRDTTSEPFREPVNLGAVVNSSQYHELAPSISSDGLALFFSSNRPGVHGLWLTTRETVDNPWREPQPLAAINTSGIEAAPDISSDGSMLYFLSNRAGGRGLTDIWQVPILAFESISLNGRGDTYVQDFDEALGIDGKLKDVLLPKGWTSTDNGIIFENATIKSFPAGSSLGRGTPIYNAGEDQNPDRALAMGVTGRSDGGMLQLLAEVTEHDATSVELQFDMEVWDAATQNADLPGEAALDVTMEIDAGEGFTELVNLGTVTTGAVLLPSATAEFLNGNLSPNRIEFDRNQTNVDIPAGSTLRIRWMPNLDAQSTGWVYGLDNVQLSVFGDDAVVPLQSGDADQDLDFDQLDLVQVQIAAKYLTGQPATWGEGDWDGAPGGESGSPPGGDGLFNQFDIIAAQQAGLYLTGTYAALRTGGSAGDGRTSVGYDANTGEVWVDAPAGTELTSINIDSAGGLFTGNSAQNLGGSFDNDADSNIFKATFGGSFGSVSFGNVAQSGLSEQFVLDDLTVVGSLAGGGDLGNVDLIYVPEPTSAILLGVGIVIGLFHFRRAHG